MEKKTRVLTNLEIKRVVRGKRFNEVTFDVMEELEKYLSNFDKQNLKGIAYTHDSFISEEIATNAKEYITAAYKMLKWGSIPHQSPVRMTVFPDPEDRGRWWIWIVRVTE